MGVAAEKISESIEFLEIRISELVNMLSDLKETQKRLTKDEASVTEVGPAIKYAPEKSLPVIWGYPKGKYHKAYQSMLDQKYGGTVTAKETYINPQATLVHTCKNCGDFYARPDWLLYKKNQRHVCNGFSYIKKNGKT
jgi:hypothetical protein